MGMIGNLNHRLNSLGRIVGDVDEQALLDLLSEMMQPVSAPNNRPISITHDQIVAQRLTPSKIEAPTPSNNIDDETMSTQNIAHLIDVLRRDSSENDGSSTFTDRSNGTSSSPPPSPDSPSSP
jgi:hypothetical protein